MKVLACGLAIAALGAGTAHATTYVGDRTVGDSTVDFSITTDGATGTLSLSDFTTYSLVIHDNGQSFPVSFSNGGSIGMLGSAVSATPTELFFDFDAPDRALLRFLAPDETEYCLGTDECDGAADGGEFIGDPDGFSQTVDSGNQMIASVAGVPEPATWAMMLVGFIGLGSVLRASERRKTAATQA